MLLCVETSVSALNPSNESFSPFPVHYTYVSQLRSCSSSIKSHDKAVKTNLTFNISLIELWFTERNGGKLTPPPRAVAQCQGQWRVVRATRKNPLPRQGKGVIFVILKWTAAICSPLVKFVLVGSLTWLWKTFRSPFCVGKTITSPSLTFRFLLLHVKYSVNLDGKWFFS